MKENYGGEDQLNEASDADALAQLLNVSIPVANAIMVAAGAAGAGLIGKLGQMVGRNAEKSSMAETNEMEEMKSELEEAYNTIKTIQTELQEVNLFNAKLLYTNKIFKAKNLTESQKVKVLAAFDKAASVKEAKLVFETLSEGMKEKKSPVNESMLRGSASKPAGVSAKKPILEVNDQFARWQTLAGIKK
jgi:ABC-type multidrug transport system fused ATPase/permease subunit